VPTIVVLHPTPASEIRTGERVRFTYHERSADVLQCRTTTCNGSPAVFFKVETSMDIFDVFVSPDQTVWRVETVGVVEDVRPEPDPDPEYRP